MLRNIRKNIRKYVKKPQDEMIRHQVLKEMTQLRKNVNDALVNKTIDEKTGNILLNDITKLRNGFGAFETGKNRKDSNIYKHILPPK